MTTRTLADAIQAEGLSGTAAEILTALVADVTIATDSTAYTWSGLSEKLVTAGVAPMVIAGMASVVNAIPGGDMLDRMLSSGGVNFAGPVVRAQLAAAAQSAPQYADVIEAILSIGITTGPRWRRAGLALLPSESEIQVAMDEAAAQLAKDALRVWLRRRCDEIDLAIIAGQIGTQEAVAAAWGE